MNLVVDAGDDDYELLPQWSVVGHQSDEWLDGDALLNLPMARSFRVEFIALEFRDAKAEVNIDDITFTNCGKQNDVRIKLFLVYFKNLNRCSYMPSITLQNSDLARTTIV